MSTLLLIGNGFDINCGMKTRYKDVYEKYIKEASAIDVIKKFKENISGNFETWADFEMAMAEYSQRLFSEEEFLECVRDFASYMEQYLIEENNRAKQLLSIKSVRVAVNNEILQSLKSFYKSISPNIERIMEQRNASFFGSFKVISFNYTDIFDELYKDVMRSFGYKPNIIHIHGALQEGPVLGVDNLSQINAGYELSKKGKRGFIKPFFNSQYDSKRVELAKENIDIAETICIFGMSLGDSDLSWRNEIIKWLKNNKEHHLFFYKYDCSIVRYRTESEKLDIEEETKEKLLSEWGLSDAEDLFDQIHIPCGKNIFNIGEVVKVELDKLEQKKQVELADRRKQVEAYVEKNKNNIIAV